MAQRTIAMNLISDVLQKEYIRESAIIGDELSDENILIKPLEVLRAHYIISDYFADTDEGKVLFGIKNKELLLSAVGRQMTTFNNIEKWKTPLEKCATLFYGLNKNHAFHDGNKRTSLLITLYNLYLISRTPIGHQKEFELLAKRIAGNNLGLYNSAKKYKDDPDAEIYIIADELKRLIRKRDKRFYALTYKEFSQKLEQLNMGYYFSEPSKGYISVYRKEKKLFRTKDIFIRKIGFPGWNRQIGAKAAKSILHDIGLTDYATFFKDGEPIYKLLEDYSAPLSRLKDA